MIILLVPSVTQILFFAYLGRAAGVHSALMGLPAKAILWVDDEVESLTSHILFLEEQGFRSLLAKLNGGTQAQAPSPAATRAASRPYPKPSIGCSRIKRNSRYAAPLRARRSVTQITLSLFRPRLLVGSGERVEIVGRCRTIIHPFA